MINQTDNRTLNNWIFFRKRVSGFKFSYDAAPGGYKFSLDEMIGDRVYTIKPKGTSPAFNSFKASEEVTTAERLISIIGDEAFVNLVENIWTPIYFNKEIDHSSQFYAIVDCFIWDRTPQGNRYWDNIWNKLRRERW